MITNNKPFDKKTNKLLNIVSDYYDENGDYSMDILTDKGNKIRLTISEHDFTE